MAISSGESRTASAFDDGSKGRRDHTLIGLRALALLARRSTRSTATRWTSGSSARIGGVNVAEEVGHGGVGQHRLRLADPRR